MPDKLTMADLLAKQDLKHLSLSRGEEVEGKVVAILTNEIILDLGIKAEGVLQKKDLPKSTLENLKIGDKLTAAVIHPENESGQVVLGLYSKLPQSSSGSARFERFIQALKDNKTLQGKGIEVNKGGLIVEINGIRGFLPSSQVKLSIASNLEDLVGKDLEVNVIEVDPSQNRLIFSQKTDLSEDIKNKLAKMKIGDMVEGEVAAVLPFGIFITLPDNVEGLIHVSEISWDRQPEELSAKFNIGDKIKAVVSSTDPNTGRVNLSIKQLTKDPFVDKSKNLQIEDVVKGTIAKVTPMGVSVNLDNGVEGWVHASKIEAESEYQVGQEASFLIDSIDSQKRRVNLAPFITSTKDLIYK